MDGVGPEKIPTVNRYKIKAILLYVKENMSLFIKISAVHSYCTFYTIYR